MAGRKPMLNRRLVEEVRGLMATMGFVAPVAGYMGISRKTFYQWYNRGRKEDIRLEGPRSRSRKSEEIYRDFYKAVLKGKYEAEYIAVGNIRRAGENQWQANAWFLERSRPERWSDKTKERAAETVMGKVLEHAERTVTQGTLDAHYEKIEQQIDSDPKNGKPGANGRAKQNPDSIQ